MDSFTAVPIAGTVRITGHRPPLRVVLCHLAWICANTHGGAFHASAISADA